MKFTSSGWYNKNNPPIMGIVFVSKCVEIKIGFPPSFSYICVFMVVGSFTDARIEQRVFRRMN